MVPDEIRRKRDELAMVDCLVNWCDDQGLADHNMPGAGPGGDLNPFGWYVVGTTGGGNGVVVVGGPCAVESLDQTRTIAERIKRAGERTLSSSPRVPGGKS